MQHATKEIKEIIDRKLEEAFKQVLDRYGIDSGDFEPMAELEYQECLDCLARLSYEQVQYNKGVK